MHNNQDLFINKYFFETSSIEYLFTKQIVLFTVISFSDSYKFLTIFANS